MRIKNHPILGKLDKGREVRFFYDGKEYTGREGEPVAAALYAAGIRIHSYSPRKKRPRGIFCMIGKCTDCVMVINGRPNLRTCVTTLEEGMDIRTQMGNTLEQKNSQEGGLS